jgi:hypothetical protein
VDEEADVNDCVPEGFLADWRRLPRIMRRRPSPATQCVFVTNSDQDAITRLLMMVGGE